MKHISEINDLKKLDDFLSGLSKSLAMAIGSWSRIPHQYLPNWGVQVTEKNREWIKKRAAMSFVDEWISCSAKANEAIEAATTEAKVDVGNQSLNVQLGEIVARILRNMHDGKRTFKIYDLGAGAGDTTISVLDALNLYEDTQRIVPYCNFRLIEPGDRLIVAEKAISQHELVKSGVTRPIYIRGSFDYFESDVGNGVVDIFISNAVLHHFPFPDHFKMIREKLAEDGVMVVGDWHNTIFSHPAFMVPLLEAVGASTDVTSEFKNRFGIKDGDRERLEAKLTPRQKECHRQFIDFQRALSVGLSKINEKLCMVESLDTFQDRVKNIEDAGFESRLEVLRRRHPGFRDLENNKKIVHDTSDVAGVVAVGKISPHRKKNPGAPEPKRRILARA